jgi:hypothetical protein
VVTNGEAATYASIDPCPDRRPDDSPLRGPSSVLLVINFGAGGSADSVVPVAENGSWTTTTAWSFPEFESSATLTAMCVDAAFTTDEVVTAIYRPRDISLVP